MHLTNTIKEIQKTGTRLQHLTVKSYSVENQDKWDILFCFRDFEESGKLLSKKSTIVFPE